MDGWLHEVGQLIQVQESQDIRYSADFSFTNFLPLVTDPAKPSCAFLLELIDPEATEKFNYAGSEKELLQAGLSFIPKELILVSAMCNKVLDHQLLAQFLIFLAEKFGSDMIDMHGELQNRPNLPGTVVEMPSKNNPEFVPVIVDVEFLKNWLKHPNFHMIK